jgi:hypothetical protein
MSDDPEGQTEAGEEPPPRWLEFLVPIIMLVVSVAYAIELKDIARPELNLLLLQPLAIVFWALLIAAGWLFLLPLVKGRSGPPPAERIQTNSPSGWRESLAEDSALRPRLLTGLLIIYALVVFHSNYVVSTFCFLVLTGFLLGQRTLLGLGALAVIGTGVLYVTATYILEIRLY